MSPKPSSRRKAPSGREPGGFVSLPWSVLDSLAFQNLSANARALLLELARQYHGDDNGRMLLSRAYLNGRGWMSSDMIIKAKRELLAGKLIHETVVGQRPHKASWYAVTWYTLDKIPGIDPDAALTFRRGAYRDVQPLVRPPMSHRTKPDKHGTKPKSAVPPHGTDRPEIVPPHGTEKAPPVPPHGPITAGQGPSPVPPHGHPLDMPSPGVTFPTPSTATTPTAASPFRVLSLLDQLRERAAGSKA